jgi:hypothetical protein
MSDPLMLHRIWSTQTDGANGRAGCAWLWFTRFAVPVVAIVIVISCCANLDIVVRVIVEAVSGGLQ